MARSFSIFLSALAVLLAGCVVGPAYRYTKQYDSAVIRVDQVSDHVASAVYDQIFVDRIDGFVAPTAHVLGTSRKADYLCVSPGKHTLALFVFHSQELYVGGKLGYSTVQAGGTIDVIVAANHRYRFAPSLAGNTFDVVLNDETGNSATERAVGRWKFKGLRKYEPD